MKKWRVLGALAGYIAFAAGVASAQTTVLQYQGDIMTGTSTSLSAGQSSPTLPTNPFIGYLTASVTLSGPLGPTSLTLESWQVNLEGSNGIDLSFMGAPEPVLVNCCLSGSGFVGNNEIGITTDDGAVTGATMGISVDPYHGNNAYISIGPSGDFFSYSYGTTQGACENLVPDYPGAPPYSGGTINPCSVQASNTLRGKWTVTAAPEIDPGFAGSALTLLLGTLVVLQGRRRAVVGVPKGSRFKRFHGRDAGSQMSLLSE